MFVFDSGMEEPARSAILGTKDEGFIEFQQQLVFTLNGRIVYQESELQDVEHPSRNQVVFDRPDGQISLIFSQNDIFAVSRESSEAGPYFELRKIN
jgi:hypothetical protein